MAASASLRIATALLWINAVGFGIPCVIGIRSLAAGNGVAFVYGFPAYGRGPFERHGIRSTVLLLSAFLAVSILEFVAGWLLLGAHKSGALLAFGLLPVGAIFWWGFALPFPPIFAVAWTTLILMNWRQLS